MLSGTSSIYLGTVQGNNVATDTKRHPATSPDTQNGCLKMCGRHQMVIVSVFWCLLVSYVVWRCGEGVWGVSQRVSECCLWAYLMFGFLQGSIWVFRLCMMQQSFYIGKSRKGKIPHTLHFSNIRIPKPPYISSLKIIRLLNFLNFLGLSEENYNLQSLWITLYELCALPYALCTMHCALCTTHFALC